MTSPLTLPLKGREMLFIVYKLLNIRLLQYEAGFEFILIKNFCTMKNHNDFVSIGPLPGPPLGGEGDAFPDDEQLHYFLRS